MRSKKQVIGSESGRSMVEMLGVLAIMGVLAIGGIAGYRYAVDKYRSNELWNNVKWISVQVMTDGSLQGMSNGDEMMVKSFSGDSELILKRETANGYSVRAGNLRESTCRQIRRDKPDWIEEVVSNEGAGCQDREDNAIKIYFNGQLNNETTDAGRYKRCEGDEECGACGRCSEEKICINYDNLCQAPTPYCINGSCEPCPAGEVLVGQKCYTCLDDNREFGGVKETDCHQCSNRFFHSGSYCSDCVKDTRSHWTTREECLRCSNRYIIDENVGACFICLGQVNADQTDCKWDCPSGQVGAGGQCYECNVTTEELSPSNSQTCLNCPNRFLHSDFYCTLCSSSKTRPAKRSDCLHCPNRYMPGTSETGTCFACIGTVNADGTACDWNCPEGQVGAGSACYDCHSDTVEFSMTTQESCHQCDNRFFHNGEYCSDCVKDTRSHWTTREECWRCPNRYMPGTGVSGVCYLCDGTVSADGTACLPKSE